MRYRPQAYVGHDHETLGSDVLAFLKAVPQPERVVGPELAAEIATVDPDGWYSINLLLEVLDALEQRMGSFGLKSVGWAIIRDSHAHVLRSRKMSTRELFAGFNALYHTVNRGEGIGGWRVLEFGPGRTLLENTTPHPCLLEEGLIEEALRTIGTPGRVTQPACVRHGAAACHFLVESSITDERWTG